TVVSPDTALNRDAQIAAHANQLRLVSQFLPKPSREIAGRTVPRSPIRMAKIIRDPARAKSRQQNSDRERGSTWIHHPAEDRDQGGGAKCRKDQDRRYEIQVNAYAHPIGVLLDHRRAER